MSRETARPLPIRHRGLWRAWTEITPKSRHRGRSSCLTPCTSTTDPRHVGPAGEPDRLADSLVGPAVELARQWLESAAPTRSERAQARRLHALTSDPGSVSFAMAFCDRVLRPESPRVAARQLRRLAGGPKPAFLSPADRTLLRWGARLSSALPGTVVPLARRRLRALVGDLVADAQDPALGHHLARLRAEGFGVNVNLLGEAVLGHEEAGRRRDALVALMGRSDIDYVSVKVSSVAAQLNLWSYGETLARTKDAVRPMLRAAASASPPTFVNLDMEEYKDLSLTVDTFTHLLDEPEFLELEVGVVLQAYIPDSLDALVRLTAWALQRRRRGGAPVKVRIVKGANLAAESVDAAVHGWPLAPFGTKAGTDANTRRCSSSPCVRNTRVRWPSAWPVTTSSTWPGPICWPTHAAWSRRSPSRCSRAWRRLRRGPCATATGSVLLYTPVVAPDDFDHGAGLPLSSSRGECRRARTSSLLSENATTRLPSGASATDSPRPWPTGTRCGWLPGGAAWPTGRAVSRDPAASSTSRTRIPPTPAPAVGWSPPSTPIRPAPCRVSSTRPASTGWCAPPPRARRAGRPCRSSSEPFCSSAARRSWLRSDRPW